MCHTLFGAMAAATNFHFGASLIRPLNNMCQVINRAFPLNYHGSKKNNKKLSRLQKCLRRPEMYKQLVSAALRRISLCLLFCSLKVQLNSTCEDK